MAKTSRTYARFEQPRIITPGGTVPVYCQTCGREIGLYARSTIRSITKCAICVLKEQGVENAEELVLPQYMQLDPSKPPVPVGMDDGYTTGIEMLFPEVPIEEGRPPMAGGVVGTVRAIFRAFGFGKPKTEPSPSQQIAQGKRKRGLYD